MTQPTQRQVNEHGWCLQLKGSQAFAFYLDELAKKASHAMREATAQEPAGSRDYHAGRLSALTDAAQLVDKKYRELAVIVEVIGS